MRIVQNQTLSALLMVVIVSACTSIGPDGRAGELSVEPTLGEASAGILPAPLGAGVSQAPTAQEPVVQAPAAAQEPADGAADDGWSFLVKPYLFAYGMKGTVGTGKRSTDVDAEFDDLFDALNFGGMLVLEAGLPDSDWTLLTDLMYVQIEDDGLTRGPVGLAVDAQIEQFIGELSVAYELIDDGQLEVLGGVRYWYTSTELQVSLPGGPQRSEGSEDWFDPLVGARSRLELGRDFDLYLRGDMGGFGVGSDFTFNLAAEVGWSISDTFQVALGYRYLDVDYSGDAIYDMTQAGPTLGVAIRF